jgi:hypothetical protein
MPAMPLTLTALPPFIVTKMVLWSGTNKDGDDLKILGAYSTENLANARIETARLLPGFTDEPDCFYVDCYRLDRDCWKDGFISVDPDEP